jgi:hypothetical protein
MRLSKSYICLPSGRSGFFDPTVEEQMKNCGGALEEPQDLISIVSSMQLVSAMATGSHAFGNCALVACVTVSL